MENEENGRKYIFVWGESDSMFLLEAAIRIYKEAKDVIGCEPDNFVITVQKRVDRAYYLESDLARGVETGKKLLEPAILESYFNGCRKSETDYLAFKTKFDSIKVSEVTSEKLFKLLEEYQHHFIRLLAHYEVSAVPSYLEPIEIQLKKLVPESKDYEPLVRTPEFTEVEKEEIALLNLSLRDTPTTEEILEHIRKFPQLAYNEYSEPHLLEYVQNRLCDVQTESRDYRTERMKRLEVEKIELKTAQERTYAKYPNQEVRRLAKAIQEMGHWRFLLKKYWGGAEFSFLSLFAEIARRLDVDVETLMSVFGSEDTRKALIEGKSLSPEEISTRKQSYTLVLWDGQLQLLTGAEERNFIDAYLRFDATGITELHGSIAQKGYAKGIARLVHIKNDLAQLSEDTASFQQGDVLVTTMTQINVVPLMKKASAILTEQGGIVSHAAITARELKKPCLVGVANVTQILKDGDLVEVDAEKGVVRILERKS